MANDNPDDFAPGAFRTFTPESAAFDPPLLFIAGEPTMLDAAADRVKRATVAEREAADLLNSACKVTDSAARLLEDAMINENRARARYLEAEAVADEATEQLVAIAVAD